MSLGPLDLLPVVERLRSQIPELQLVGGAADRAAATESVLRLPAAFVILAAENIKSEPLTGGVFRHQSDAQIDVLVGLRHYQANQRGSAHAEVGIALVSKVRQALAGWTPAGPSGARVEPIRCQGRGQLLKLSDAEWWWVDPFICTYRSRA